MFLHRLRALILLPILVVGTGCEDLREFRLEADPPIDVIRIGTDLVGRETPFLYPIPSSMRSEPEPDPSQAEEWDMHKAPRFMTMVIQESDFEERLFRFQKVFRYPAARPSMLSRGRVRPQGWRDVVLPGIGTRGRIWLRASGPRYCLYSARRGKAMIVRHPMTAQQRFFESGDPELPMAHSGTTVEQVVPGKSIFSMEHWHLEMVIPEGLCLFIDEGQGKSDFVHLSYPKDLDLRLGKPQAKAGAKWVHSQNSLLAPLLEDAKAWTTSIARYGADGEVSFEVQLPHGKSLRLRVRRKGSQKMPPPLLMALTMKR